MYRSWSGIQATGIDSSQTLCCLVSIKLLLSYCFYRIVDSFLSAVGSNCFLCFARGLNTMFLTRRSCVRSVKLIKKHFVSTSTGTVSIDTIYSKLRFLAEGLKSEEERDIAMKKINSAFEAHKIETDENKIQELLAEAQSHLTFYKMVSRRRLPKELDEDKDELSNGQHFVMDKKTGELVETDSILSEKLVGNKNKIIDKSQVTSEHRRKHEQLLRRQHFLGRK